MTEGKSIFTPKTARALLKMGNVIIDIKPDKSNHDKTIFVFRNDDKLKQDLSTLSVKKNTIAKSENVTDIFSD
jgi:hypothetical protein